jgi:Helix-hairpin-helix domain
MLTLSTSATGSTTVTFSLDTDRPVSVVGDFNEWNPLAHPMRPFDDLMSVTVELTPGRWAFRYLAEGGQFFDDIAATFIEPNGWGETHSVLVIDEPRVIDQAAGPDDLTRLEGIGPKIAAALAAGGVTTYLAIATASADELRAVLIANGIKFAPSITTWSEQAQLLAKRDEPAFAALVAELTAGRRR